jgi:hypothetical protein
VVDVGDDRDVSAGERLSQRANPHYSAEGSRKNISKSDIYA